MFDKVGKDGGDGDGKKCLVLFHESRCSGDQELRNDIFNNYG